MPIPDFTNELLDRFEICNGEISTVGRVNRVAPHLVNPSNTHLPLIYTMPDRVATFKRSEGLLEVTRDYLLSCLVKATSLDRREPISGDSELVTAALNFEYLVLDYYARHPRLHTDGVPVGPPLSFYHRLAPERGIEVVSSEVTGFGQVPPDKNNQLEAPRPAYVGVLVRIRTACYCKV
jgi:hypothetical protein